MTNTGPDSNTSQFFITLGPAKHLDNNNCVFGEVVEGLVFIRQIGSVPTDLDSDAPLYKCGIINCGVISM